jgi:peptidyl-prolyl cis-trans isomerase B (cyclophilin B)
MKQIFLLASLITVMMSCKSSKDSVVIIHTKFGDMKAILYEETPKHKKNFLSLIESGQLDSTNFHRVIKDFMIQGGDVNKKKNIDNDEKINYTIDAEIVDDFWHVKGALAAARQGDQVNPKKESSGSQFYIVDGQKFTEADILQMQQGRKYQQKQIKLRECLKMTKYSDLRDSIVNMQRNQNIKGLQTFLETKADSIIELEFGKVEGYQYSEAQIEDYKEVGGSPHLDGEYTVFGRVVEGLGIIDSIAAVQTGAGDKPLESIYMTFEIDKMSKKKITEQFGYFYPKSEEE